MTGAEWYVHLQRQNASYLNISFDLVEFSATDIPASNSQGFVLFRKRPGYPDIFCISESDVANVSYVRLGAARGHACATFSHSGTAGAVSLLAQSSFRSFGISPFAFRNTTSTIVGIHELCIADRAPQMAQVFALGCNVTRKGDVFCDIKNPSRSVLLRVSCDGRVEKLRIKNDTVILSPVACVVEGRLEPSDLFCRDPTSAHQLLGPLGSVYPLNLFSDSEKKSAFGHCRHDGWNAVTRATQLHGGAGLVGSSLHKHHIGRPEAPAGGNCVRSMV